MKLVQDEGKVSLLIPKLRLHVEFSQQRWLAMALSAWRHDARSGAGVVVAQHAYLKWRHSQVT